MNRLNSLVVAGLSIVLVAGCASTSESTKSNAPVSYPELKVLSDKPYVWDNSISEALNVARMAQPAGVGNGMQDFPDGKKATTGRIGGGERAFDAGLGLLSQGVFGVISMEALNQGVNRQLDWMPSLIQLVPVSNISNLDTGDIYFDKVVDVVSKSVKSAIDKEYGSLNWGDVYTLKKHEISNISILIKDLSICRPAMNYITKNKDHVGYVDLNYSHFYLNGKDAKEKHCGIAFKTKVAGRTFHDGIEKYIVVSELKSGHYFLDSIQKNFEGYVIVPDFFAINASDSASSIAVITDYAFVSKSGNKLLFEKKIH